MDLRYSEQLYLPCRVYVLSMDQTHCCATERRSFGGLLGQNASAAQPQILMCIGLFTSHTQQHSSCSVAYQEHVGLLCCLMLAVALTPWGCAL